jgi:glutathione S-transferase
MYFDAPASRGEECRLALHLAGVSFEDVRIKGTDWPALKPTTPFGSVPVLEWPGHPPLGQSNAILVLVGRRHDLHPRDDFEAARHEAVMQHVEDLRAAIGPTMRMKDTDKQAARQALAEGVVPTWAAQLERQLTGDGPFFAGAKLHVVDLKLYMIVRWLQSGALDHIPATIFSGYPKLVRVHDAVRDHEGVKAWNARQ